MKRLLSTTALFGLFLSINATNTEYLRILVSDSLDKMEEAWLGQMIGCGWGLSIEFKGNGSVHPDTEKGLIELV